MHEPKRIRPTLPLCLHLSPRRLARRAFGLLAPLILPLASGQTEDADPAPSPASAIGLPFIRSYSLDEIGVSRGVQLGFDPIGRLTVIDRNKYVALNDSNWIDLLQDNPQIRNLRGVANDSLGNTYFGSLASWGLLELNKNGKRSPLSFRPKNAPEWVDSTNFDFVVPRPDGVVFGGQNGLVYWDRETDTQTFFEAPDLARVFSLGETVYLSSHSRGVAYLDLPNKAIVPLLPEGAPFFVIDQIAPLDASRAIVSTTGNRLGLFDGSQLLPWSKSLGTHQSGHVSNIVNLPEGGFAISIDEQGLYLLSETGECLRALASDEYLRINHLASSEPGVLWVSTENDVQKVLYQDPVSILDQRSGIPVSWPVVIEWQGRPLIVSHGALFEIAPNPDGFSRRFQRFPTLPQQGVMGAASLQDQLLVGNGQGVFALRQSTFEPVLTDIEVNRLITIGQQTVLCVGRTEIAALRWDGQTWSEAAPRRQGVGFPFIALTAPRSAWLELGVNQVARLALRDGQIQAEIFDDLPWKGSAWVHAGLVGNLVVLSGPENELFFYDETTERLTEAPQLKQLIQQAPAPPTRIAMDSAGTIWAAYEQGIYTIHPESDTHKYDLLSYNTLRELSPFVQLSSNDVWVSTGNTLYHVNPKPPAVAPPLQPTLVSIQDQKTRENLYSIFNANQLPQNIPYSQNNLELLFFAGSYASARTPHYEFKTSTQANDWTIRSPDSTLSLPNLQEGNYQLFAQLFDADQALGSPLRADLAITPPWFRSPLAYLLYAALALAAFLSALAIATQNSKRRQAYLETLVQERTDELRATMEKLGEKERNAAILAERNRLAAEIHDSVQQGLSGLALQLDATLKLPQLAQAVLDRLAVARRMVTYTRHEVQQAVWDLESPFLENDDLAAALEKIASYTSSQSTKINLNACPLPQALDPLAQHNLLRIAQEAIANAIRHGKATTIAIELQSTDATTTLAITDDGCGFDTDNTLKNSPGHFGLRGMKARAAKIKATLEIVSAPGSGTSITVSIPSAQNQTT